MDLYKEILTHILAHEDINITFPNLRIDAERIVEMACYRALKKIKAIIEDDSLSDEMCFIKIEKIIYALEEVGGNGGIRHDFG